MSVGVESKKNNAKKQRGNLSIDYDGKQAASDILTKKFNNYDKIISLNGSENNLFLYGDNQDGMLYLLNSGYRNKINLIYIDPPFATKSTFLNNKQDIAYKDLLFGAEYIEFLRSRIIIMYHLLSDNGSIYIHLDSKMVFYIKIIMDEIFGHQNFRSFITRKKCSTKNYTKKTYGDIADYILFYSKSNNYTWNRPLSKWSEDKIKEQYPCFDNIHNKRFKKVPLHAPGTRNGDTGKKWRDKLPPPGKHWQYPPQMLDKMDENGEIYWSPSGNPRRIIFFNPDSGIPVQNIWMEYRDSINQSQKTTGYPTEKNINMLEMIISASSNKDDLILDCFAGSGTTLGAAFKLGRQWIGIDNSIESVKSILKRFNGGLEAYGDYVNPTRAKQLPLEIKKKCAFHLLSPRQESNRILELFKKYI